MIQKDINEMKKVINQFISDELTMENKSALADEIVTCFLSEDKRDCKKIIVNGLKTCSEKDLKHIEEAFVGALNAICAKGNHEGICGLTTMLNDLALSEKILLANFQKVACLVLERLKGHKLKHVTMGSAERNIITSQLLFTIQFFSKLMHKYIHRVCPVTHEEGDKEKNNSSVCKKDACDEQGDAVMEQLYEEHWIILQEGSLDLSLASAISLLLFLRLSHESTLLPKVSALLDSHCLSTTPLICLVHASLAILSPHQLLSKHLKDVCLLDGLMLKLNSLQGRLSTTNHKLAFSRTLLLLAKKTNTQANFLLHYASSNIDSPLNTLRHQAKQLFELVLQGLEEGVEEREIMEERGFEQKRDIDGETRDKKRVVERLSEQHLKAFDWSVARSYPFLCCLVRHASASHFVSVCPSLLQHLVCALNNHACLPHACQLLEELWRESWKEAVQGEVAAGVGDKSSSSEQRLQHWLQLWVLPVLSALHPQCASDTVTQVLLPKLFQLNPACIKAVMEALNYPNNHNIPPNNHHVTTIGLKMLLTCMRHSQNTRAAFEGSLSQALCHDDQQLRLDALRILCERDKTTEEIPDGQLLLVSSFLEHNLDSQSSAFRQKIIACLKKLLTCVKESALNVSKKAKQGDHGASDLPASLLSYKAFLTRTHALCFSHLHPACLSKSTSLEVLTLLRQSFEEREGLPWSWHVLPLHVSLLVSCLTDSYEGNKQLSFALLCSSDAATLQNCFNVETLLTTAMRLSQSVRPPDGPTAAFLLRLLVRLLPSHRLFGPSDVQDDASLNHKLYLLLARLVDNLQRHIEVAKRSLLRAAISAPMHPVLLCISALLQDVLWSDVKDTDKWRDLIDSIVSCCIEVAAIVAVLINSDSPEGHMIEEEEEEEEEEEQEEKEEEEEEEEEEELVVPLDLTEASPSEVEEALEGKVRLMPEFLVVCCWRSVKEASLLLGFVCSHIPIHHGNQDSSAVLSVETVLRIGDFLKAQLLESRHRGAFELAYVGFSQLVATLWGSHQSHLRQLPQQWLHQLLPTVTQHDHSEQLCSTRRSAGVPYFFLAIVASEPAHLNDHSLTTLAQALLHATSLPTPVHHTQHVHCRNVLRALLRDSRVGRRMGAFVGRTVQLAIEGYNSTHWPVKNASAMLFSVLVKRIFGAKKLLASTTARIVGITCKAFFAKYPPLFDLFQQHLSRSSPEQPQASAFLVLIMISNLLPSPLEEANLKSLVDLVCKQASSPVWQVRQMAAKALVCLLPRDQVHCFVLRHLQQLSRRLSHNTLHGLSLQVLALLDGCFEDSSEQEVLQVFDALLCIDRLYHSDNPCLVTRHSCLQLMQKVLPRIASSLLPSLATFHSSLSEAFDSFVASFNTPFPPSPAQNAYHSTLTSLVLTHRWKSKQECLLATVEGVLEGCCEDHVVQQVVSFLCTMHAEEPQSMLLEECSQLLLRSLLVRDAFHSVISQSLSFWLALTSPLHPSNSSRMQHWRELFHFSLHLSNTSTHPNIRQDSLLLCGQLHTWLASDELAQQDCRQYRQELVRVMWREGRLCESLPRNICFFLLHNNDKCLSRGLWTCMLHTLQQQHPLAAVCLCHLTKRLPPPHQTIADMHASRLLDTLLHTFFTIECSSRWTRYSVCTVLRWLLPPLRPQHSQTGQVRLFDRSSMDACEDQVAQVLALLKSLFRLQWHGRQEKEEEEEKKEEEEEKQEEEMCNEDVCSEDVCKEACREKVCKKFCREEVCGEETLDHSCFFCSHDFQRYTTVASMAKDLKIHMYELSRRLCVANKVLLVREVSCRRDVMAFVRAWAACCFLEVVAGRRGGVAGAFEWKDSVALRAHFEEATSTTLTDHRLLSCVLSLICLSLS